MIQDFKFTLNDFELKYAVLKEVFKSEKESIKVLFQPKVNEPPNLYEYLLFIRNSNDDKYKTIKNNSDNYQVFFLNVAESTHLNKNVLNNKVNEILNGYKKAMNFSEDIHDTTIAMILMQPLNQNYLKYLNDKEFNYSEVDLYKRICILDTLGLLRNHTFLVKLRKLFQDEYGLALISKKDIENYNQDVSAKKVA